MNDIGLIFYLFFIILVNVVTADDFAKISTNNKTNQTTIYRAKRVFSDDITMVICPGFANHSGNVYIRTFVDHSQRQGYRCAVLNHLGALPDMELTAPRMFTYGKDKRQIINGRRRKALNREENASGRRDDYKKKKKYI